MRKVLLLLAAAAASMSISCVPPEEANVNSRPEARKLTAFEQEIKSLKTADFDHIYVLRRKDGGAMTDEDKDFIRANRHFATNRSSLSEDGKVVFIGTNFEFEKESLDRLKERFLFEDFSKPAEQIAREKAEKGAKNVNAENGPAANK